MNSTLETLAYGVAASVLVFGSLYGLARVVESPAPGVTPAIQPAPPPARPAPMPSAWQPPPQPAPQNVVRTATRTYYLLSVPQAQSDVYTHNELRSNCYANARNNSYGEFPSLQQAACDRFANFARSRGWDTGPLPAYAPPRPREVGEQVMVIGQAEPVDEGQCAWLYQQEQNVEAAMRTGYVEPRGNQLRAEQRDLMERMRQQRCRRR
jgi:hypothetical protein